MKRASSRRRFVKELAAAGFACSPLGKAMTRLQRSVASSGGTAYDLAIIGAGVFGAWTAYHARMTGMKVVLLDAHGPANARASSGGESRIIRMGYGADEIYTRWSMRSLELWKDYFQRTGQKLFHATGVLWMAREQDVYLTNTMATLQKVGVRFEKLSRSEMEKRFPQIHFEPDSWGVFEPESGALMARRAVQAVVEDAVRAGIVYRRAAVGPIKGKGRLEILETSGGEQIRAARYAFACGPWLPKLFPALLGNRIHPTRQEVLFFGTSTGEVRFAPPAMPAWIDFNNEAYGIPDLESRGFKIAPDRHGPTFDPDTGERIVSAATIRQVRKYIARRFPLLKSAPLVEARVCQYENTSNGDFLIDRHPDFENVWLIGGGSGHGFKHGPAVGEYAVSRILDRILVDPRFSLSSKKTVQRRSVY